MYITKLNTWHDVPDVAPTSGTWPSEAIKHAGVTLLALQVFSLPHLHVPSTGLATVPEAVHCVLSDVVHFTELVDAHTHCAALPKLGGLHIGFKRSHP
jgi:hypothetical protein